MTPAALDPGLSALPLPEQVTLRDGSSVTIRPIRPDDAPRLQAGYLRISRDTMYFRFHSFSKELPAVEADRLANVDYRKRMAFVATREGVGDAGIVGVARYEVADPGAPDLAQCAVIVGDGLQRQGLGSALLRCLGAYARSQGIRTFAGAILSSNAAMLGFVKHSGLQYRLVHVEGGVAEVYVELGTRA